MIDRFYYDLHQALVYVRSIVDNNIRFEHTVDKKDNYTPRALQAAGKELLLLTFNIYHMANTDRKHVHNTHVFVPE